MNNTLTRTGSDLKRALMTVQRTIEQRATTARRSASDRLEVEVKAALPEADVTMSETARKTTVHIADDDLLVREFGSVNRQPDQPVTRILEKLSAGGQRG